MAESDALDPKEIAAAVGTIKDQVVQAVQEASERFELERRMNEQPWMVLGMAAGAGFLLGGGLWPVLRPVLKAAGRAMLSPSNLIAAAAAVGAIRAAQGAQEEEATEGQSPTIVVPSTH